MSGNPTLPSNSSFQAGDGRREVRRTLEMARILMEKCEHEYAEEKYILALNQAREIGAIRLCMEAISGLLRHAADRRDRARTEELKRDLDQLIEKYPEDVPPMAYYCQGAIYRVFDDPKKSLHYFFRYLKSVREDRSAEAQESYLGFLNGSQLSRPDRGELAFEAAEVRGWLMVAVASLYLQHPKRARFLAETIIAKYEHRHFRSINATVYLVMGQLAESEKDLASAKSWYGKAQTESLVEHNWSLHLYTLMCLSRLARLNGDRQMAGTLLEIVEKAVGQSKLESLIYEVSLERGHLSKDHADLMIDVQHGKVRTREQGEVAIGKQYVLIGILSELAQAASSHPNSSERGLSKAEIIERVWGERYRPEAHDNKLYYNINRLRKLIEPDQRQPKYLLNWREGYRLSPDLKIQLIR